MTIVEIAAHFGHWDHIVVWHSGRTLVFDRQTFPILRSPCSWRV